jgi:hypothetical protein
MAKQKSYNITKRFQLYLTKQITAESFEKAVERGRELKDEDFFTVKAEYVDGEQIDGFGVQEVF